MLPLLYVQGEKKSSSFLYFPWLLVTAQLLFFDVLVLPISIEKKKKTVYKKEEIEE